MIFEWSEASASRNLARYGVRFTEAVHVFLDPKAVEFLDERRSRLSLIGHTALGLLYVVFEETADGRIRLLHARVADAPAPDAAPEFDFDTRRIKRTERPSRHLASAADVSPRNCKVSVTMELDADVVAAFRDLPVNAALREVLRRKEDAAAGSVQPLVETQGARRQNRRAEHG
ncbi:MAG: BrnT family toxin [Bryobacteraceae bacterium]|nr:BrnT family toxin [Bryobacteraceae bacterium]